MPDAPPAHTNRLAGESSPYLLQHAHNPVDWYPWGPEAFAAARERGVPVFLSIGYSTCYWCHVMERECFENEAIAAQMNTGFVCIKVDREQRPYVDDVYMTAVQLLTGSGGWPMSVFLTPPGARGEDDPGLEPFWGGTYFPPEPRTGMPSFPQVLDAMSGAYANQKPQVLEQAASVTQAVRAHLTTERTPVRLDDEPARRALDALRTSFDPTNGGFHGAPKFPQPVFLEFLLDVSGTTGAFGDGDRVVAASMLRLTLDKMAEGGINDQVGGGFHRYSVDATWTVPHFEKMLYDQGQLASVYARAAGAFDDPFYARVAARTCAYVLREMTDESGGFYSAQDAEVDAREGLNYLWTADELVEVLGRDDAAFAASVYGVDAGPNFQDPHHPSEPPRSVLRLSAGPDELARASGLTAEAFWERLDRINTKLLGERLKRAQPRLDDKVICGWNGLMIAGMAETGAALHDERLTEAAARTARFVLAEMRDADGGLLRVWRAGKAEIPALFEDYAFLIRGLLALHRATGAPEWRDSAVELALRADSVFGSPEGGWYDAPEDRADLIVRLTSTADGAVPSATSVMLNDLVALREADDRFGRLLGRGLASVSSAVVANPLSLINTVRAVERLDDPAMLAEHGMRGAAAGEPPAPDVIPVEVFASTDTVTVGPGGAELSLELRITPGYHLNAHRPGIEGFIGVDVHIEGGMGFDVIGDFPAGSVYTGGAAPEGQTLFVYKDAARVDLRIEPSGEPVTGTPRLVVTYQACTDRACLRPMRTVLGVEILAASGESP